MTSRSVLGLGAAAFSAAAVLCCVNHSDLLPRVPFAMVHLISVPSAASSTCARRGMEVRRTRVARRMMRPSDQPIRTEHDNSAKWDPVLRKKTKSPEEAERILRLTGRIPRPLRLSDVKKGAAPLRKTIVANAKERRAAAEMVGIYSVSKIQARLLVHREVHPVWGHDRVLVYGNMISEYMVPDVYSNDPIEMSVPLKFKAAFREDADPYFPSKEAQWNKELERRGLKPEVAEGKVFERMLQKRGDPSLDVPDNMFVEAILDNVVDLGEIVLQFYALHMDRQPTSQNNKKGKLNRRLNKRMRKELGMNFTFDIEDKLEPIEEKPTAQELQDYSGGIHQLNGGGRPTGFKFKRVKGDGSYR